MEIGRISWSEGDSDVARQNPEEEQLDKPPARPPRSRNQERGAPNRARAASAGPQSSQQLPGLGLAGVTS